MPSVPIVPLHDPRPRWLTPERKRAAANKLATALVRAGMIEDRQRDASASDVAKIATLHMDGYLLAKTLDDRCRWDCTRDMVDILDSWSVYADAELAAAEKEWAERTGIQSPHPTGTRIQIPSGETGTIDGIYQYGVARFTVIIDGDPQSAPPHHARRIVLFEDATALDTPALPKATAA